ncbi:MAG TPA: hypothetical protein PLZ15_10375 [Melioribacteraceae bacterium]|nr:hypothetical protein [Melioribacteraceae bacterium]
MKYSDFKKYIVLFILLVSNLSYAQFEVEFNETKGSLTLSDNLKPEFGRYDGYRIPLYKGETVNFIVFSEKFNPGLIFVTPQGDVFKQSDKTTPGFASIITDITEDGEWILYVVGDSSSVGEYQFQYAIAGSNSVSLPADADFCTSLQFILAHSNAFFLLLENRYDSSNSFIKLKGAKDSFIDESDGSFTSVFLETDNLNEAEKLHKDLINSISSCLDKNWKSGSSDWRKNVDYRVKETVFTENIKDSYRIIKIELLDLKGSKEKFLSDYAVQVVINKNR